MRTVLSVEQAKEVAAAIQTLIDRHAQDTQPVLSDETEEIIAARQKRWQSAKLDSLEQLAEINELECYFVVLQFQDHFTHYVLARRSDGTMNMVQGYTFRPPAFTHLAQSKEQGT